MHSSPPPPPDAQPRPLLSVFDAACIIVGIIIGSAFYETAPRIAQHSAHTGLLLSVWVGGGIFALIGALCYAELASAWPEEGGDYVYLTRGWGETVGFLFAWSQIWIMRPAFIGTVAFVFARYATQLWPLGPNGFLFYAAGSVAVLSLINAVGVRQAAWTQNVLTTSKVVGLLAVALAGLFFAAEPPLRPEPLAREFNLYLAIIFVLFTYGGWNDVAFVAAEIRNPTRNVSRALLAGTTAVVAIYLLVNLAFLNALGLAGTARSEAVAAEVTELMLGPWGARAVSVLICVSALGAVHGMILTGARLYYAFGREHHWFAWLGRWNPRLGTPLVALLAQAGITLAMIAAAELWPNSATGDAFERLLLFSSPLFWFFLLLSALALFRLRQREPERLRPFRVPAYPLVPLLFSAGCLFMFYASLSYALSQYQQETVVSVVLLAAGPLVYWSQRRRPDPRP